MAQVVRFNRETHKCLTLTDFSLYLIMSTLQNEVLLENIYEEVMTELIDTETLAKYTEEMINSEVIRRFWDYTN